MATLKIAPTLLNSFDFYIGCPESWKVRAYEGLVSTIKRAPFKPTPEITKGLNFEAQVQKRVEGCLQFGWKNHELPGSTEFKIVVDRCMYGKFQVWGERTYDVPGYGKVKTAGKADVLFPKGSDHFQYGKIIDIKTTGNFKDERKYTESWQPLVYGMFWEIPYFQFLVAVWEDTGSTKIKSLKAINMKLDLETAEERIVNQITNLYTWLNLNGLWEDYFHTYCKNPR